MTSWCGVRVRPAKGDVAFLDCGDCLPPVPSGQVLLPLPSVPRDRRRTDEAPLIPYGVAVCTVEQLAVTGPFSFSVAVDAVD